MADESSSKMQKILPQSSSKLTTVATTFILNDAKKGFKNGNFVCSPFSLEILLGMVAAGAEGQTLKQLLGFLGCETVDQLLYESNTSKLCKILSSSNGEQVLPSLENKRLNSRYPPGVDVSLGNGVWGAKKLSAFQSGYEEILQSVYETKPGILDFENEVATTFILNDGKKGFKNGNFVCSPFSLEILLGMVAAGAEGDTLKQLLGFLGCETVDQLLYESKTSKLCKILSSSNGEQVLPSLDNKRLNSRYMPPPGVEVSLGNGVWGAKKLSAFQSGYQEILQSVYETKPGILDFENEPDEAVEEINSWVKKKTKGLIPTIVEKNDISQDPDIKIIFANALYFQGWWRDKFLDTKEKDFHLISGDKKIVSVPFMTRGGRFTYGSFEDYTLVKLPYVTANRLEKLFSMYIFLSHKIDGLQDLLQMFHSDPDLFRTEFDLEEEWLKEFWIPKFKISNTFEPHDVMRQMGLTLPFEKTNMELTRIIESKCLDEDMLYVSKILQKSLIEIDENGTKAAACSYLRLSGGGVVLNPLA